MIEIDRFASEDNARCRRFNTRFAHPKTEEANALAQEWLRDELSYACPPMAMVGKVLALVMEQKTRAVIVSGLTSLGGQGCSASPWRGCRWGAREKRSPWGKAGAQPRSRTESGDFGRSK